MRISNTVQNLLSTKIIQIRKSYSHYKNFLITPCCNMQFKKKLNHDFCFTYIPLKRQVLCLLLLKLQKPLAIEYCRVESILPAERFATNWCLQRDTNLPHYMVRFILGELPPLLVPEVKRFNFVRHIKCSTAWAIDLPGFLQGAQSIYSNESLALPHLNL